MTAALAARNIKSILDEYERACDWFTKTYQREPTTFCRYNDKLDRFEVTLTAPVGSKYIESTAYIEGPKLYDQGYCQVVAGRIFPGLKREIAKKIEENERLQNAEKEIERSSIYEDRLQRFIQKEGKVPLLQESQTDSRKVLT